MNRTFKNVAFFFFMGFGVIYLGADFMLNQGQSDSETLQLIYQTFDMPFFFCAGMYGLSCLREFIKKRLEFPGLNPLIWTLALIWMGTLIYLNLGYESFL
ncbi:MAG: hypothetical protein P1V18_01455 [Candidatus Gracilibacteria bacterium]|nr:hypothetical protein [Candidatus Gracilibacteria bacterium]